MKTMNQIAEINTKFLREWTNFETQQKQVEKAIFKYFRAKTHKLLKKHNEPLINFNPVTFCQIDNLLGLAYTSTGAYAGLWVCNGGYLMYNDTHHFTGFMINELGEVIAAAEDENENTIYINLSK